MSESTGATPTQQIRDIIQRVYGDASQTALDRQCASEIIKHLRESGWFAPEDVRMVVAGAGGRVVVPFEILTNPPTQLLVGDDYASMGKVLTTR